jgi:hypothetical protein
MNNIVSNRLGIYFGYSSGSNTIYHNNFANNSQQVSISAISPPAWPNVWDDGYPSGGNYWSDYKGTDLKSGQYQNVTGSDGIGDTSYTIEGFMSGLDNCPLMGLFSDFTVTSGYGVETICNSTVSDFQFNGTAISFNVTGETGTNGFCRVCIPTTLVGNTYRVFVDGTEILPPPSPLPNSNSTHSYLYFNYTHSTEKVIIITEYSSFLILPLSMIATLLAVVIYKRKERTVR